MARWFARLALAVALLSLLPDASRAVRPLDPGVFDFAVAVRPPGAAGPAAAPGSGGDDAASAAPVPSRDAPVSMPARYAPLGFSPARGDSAALRRTPLPGCAMHVFRHVSKAAGTTMRFIFDKQVAMGDWEFLPMCHYGFREGDWRTTVERFREAAVDPERVATGRGPRVIVEIRNEWGASEAFERVVLPDLDALREYTSAVGCEITSSLLFRDPPAQYRSFYEYYIEKLRDGKDLPRGDGPESWGAEFEEWAAEIPDLQLRELLGDRCTPKLREAPFETTRSGDARPERVGAKPLPESCKVSLGDRARFEKIVAAVDVVGVADRFDAFWLALADRVGFQHLEYVLSNAAKKKKPPPTRDAEEEGSNPEPEESGGAALERTWANDRWAYELVKAEAARREEEERAKRRTGPGAGERETKSGDEKDVSASGDDFAERLASFAASSGAKPDGRKTAGGRPPSSRFMFVEAEEGKERRAAPKEAWAKPDFYVAAPVCKGFGTEFAALVDKMDQRFQCDRGCSFD